MTLGEKIAQTPKLERIDSSIESCIKILEQEMSKRVAEDPDCAYLVDQMGISLLMFQEDFIIMKGKK